MSEPVEIGGSRSILVRLWRGTHAERGVLLPMTAVSFATVAVMAVAAIKDIVVAATFGASVELDAFLLALAIFIVVHNTVVAALNDAFLPLFVRVAARDGQEACVKLLRAMMTLGGLILTVVSLVVALVLPVSLVTLAAEFDAALRELTQSLFYVLIPALLLSGMTAVWPAVLNTRRKFIAVALTPAVTPLVTVVALLVSRDAGARLLATSVVVGKVFELAILGWHLQQLEFKIIPGALRATAAVRSIVNQAGPLAVAGLVASASTFIDQAMAAALGAGAVSLLTFGCRITTAVITIGSVVLSSVLFPEFSRLAANKDAPGLQHAVVKYTSLAFAASACIGLVLVLAAEPIVRVVFERGAFTASDTATVAQVQVAFAFQIPFHVADIVLVRLLSVLRRNQFLMWSGSAMLGIDIAGNYVLMQAFGVVGIAASTSVVFLILFGLLAGAARRWIGELSTDRA